MILLHLTEAGEITAHADTRVEASYACRGTTSDMEEAVKHTQSEIVQRHEQYYSPLQTELLLI